MPALGKNGSMRLLPGTLFCLLTAYEDGVGSTGKWAFYCILLVQRWIFGPDDGKKKQHRKRVLVSTKTDCFRKRWCWAWSCFWARLSLPSAGLRKQLVLED